ncbi:hypothetical protein H0A65_04730 [Alcaligenaceae bacterium]|nr:hypothetical protein [Alcaligenaceae bacterium]
MQHHAIDYSLRGRTLDEQAYLTLAATNVIARFCSSTCCKAMLGTLLKAQGLAEKHQHNRIEAGPIHPCAKCNKPVDMTQPHGAWVRCKQTAIWDGARWCDDEPDWFDVLAVVCADCMGLSDTQAADRACHAVGESG